jgi:menaquinone-dependent protoporphyrinogen oxidase
MKTLIIYASNHGTTTTVAKRIAEAIGSSGTSLLEVKQVKKTDWNTYDVILLGSSIHAGNNQRAMKSFVKKNMTELLQKRIGLFLCCMRQDELDVQMQQAYPETLRKHAFSYRWMGGEYKIERMNLIEKFLLKKIVGVTESESHLNQENIDNFIQEIKNECR